MNGGNVVIQLSIGRKNNNERYQLQNPNHQKRMQRERPAKTKEGMKVMLKKARLPESKNFGQFAKAI